MADELKRVGLVFKEDGAVDFKKSLQEVNLELNKNYNQFKLVQGQWDKSTTSTQKLRAEQQYLQNAYEIQADKVSTLKMQLSDLENAEEKNTTAIKKKRNELTNAELKLEAYNKRIKEIENQLHNTGKKIEEFGTKVQNIGGKIEKAGKKMSAFSGAVGAAFVASAKGAIDFESAFAGVEKTVDGTEEQMANLKQGIRDMAKEIPSTTTEISAVAEAAGQLGIQTDNILDFSKAMIDLGNSTNLSSEEAASQLAKFANITKMSQKDFNKLGSAIVDLGNNFATTEADIVNMAMRLAGAGNQVGMSQGEILGLATALSSVGIEAEMGGSAISKAMVKMQNSVELGGGKLQDVLKKTGKSLRDLELMSTNNSKDFKALADSLGLTSTELKNMITAGANLRDFSKIAGMSAEEFKKAWKKDATGALTAFITGLGKAQDKGESAITLLSEMGLTEVRLRDSLLRAANASDLFSGAIKKGTKAWEENTALTNEANKRYETLKSKIQIMINKIKDLGITFGNKLMPVIEKVTKKIEGLAKWVSNLTDEQVEWILKIAGAVVALGPLITILGKVTSTVGGVIKGIGIFTQAIGVMSGTITSTSTAVNGLASVLGAITSPAGLAIGAIGLVTSAILLMNKSSKDAERETKKSFENIGTAATNFLNGIDTAKSHLGEFNRTLFVSSEEQQKLQKQMDDVQKGITTICKTASNERRDYTQKEIKQLDEYFKKLRELNQRELEIEQSIATAISQQAATNAETFQGSLEEYKIQSQEWIKTAEEQKDKTIELINTQTTEEIALLNQRFGTKATMENEAYKAEYEKILGNKENKIQQANDEVAKISNIYANGYQKRVEQVDGLFQQLQSYNNKYQEETKRHNQKIQDIQNGNFNWILGKTKESQMEHEKYGENTKKIWDEMYKNMSQEQEKELGIWLANVAQTEMYGGQITEENKELVDTIIASYDKMPKETREAMKNAMTPMLEEMEKKEPTLFSKATSIANGILNRLRKAFDEHSPSKKTREIFKYVMLGAEEGLESEKKSLYNKMDDIANGMLDEIKNELEIQSPSKKFKNQVGKNIALGVIAGVDSQKSNVKKSSKELAKLYVDAAKEKVTKLKENNKITETEEVNFWKTIVNNTKKGTSAYTTAVNKLNEAKKNLKNDISSLTKKYVSDVDEAQKNLNDGIANLRKTYNDSVNNRKNEIVNSLSLFNDVKFNENLSKETLTKNLKNQVNALKEWDTTLDKLRQRIGNSDLLQELEKQGVSSLNILQELNTMSNDELQEYVNLYKEKNNIALERSRTENQTLLQQTEQEIAELKQNAEEKMKELKNTYIKDLKNLGVTAKSQSKEVGKQITTGIDNGIKEGMSSLKSSTKSQIKSLIKTVKKQLKIKSPSRVFRDEIGKNMALGIKVGFEDNLKKSHNDIKSSIDNETQDIKNDFTDGLENIDNGMIFSSRSGTNYEQSNIGFDYNKMAQSIANALTNCKFTLDEDGFARIVKDELYKVV